MIDQNIIAVGFVICLLLFIKFMDKRMNTQMKEQINTELLENNLQPL